MLVPEYDLLFVHIPKTGGQSIESYILGCLGRTWAERRPYLLRGNGDPRYGPPRLAHLTAREYLHHGYCSRRRFQRCFRFAFVRNPFTRLVSEYHYRRLEGRVTFRSFVLERFPAPSQDDYHRRIDGFRHVLPQWRFVHDDDGRSLLSFVGRFEHLAADFAHVCAMTGLPPGPLPHHNRTRGGRPVAGYYDADTIARVRDFYAEDFCRFGYAPTPPAGAVPVTV